MRILHISDLHVRAKDERDQAKLVGAMLTDVRVLHAEKPVDLVVFSGDLASGGLASEFERGKAMLLDPVQETLGIDRGDVIILPGNHDVERDRVDEYLEAGLAQKLVTREAVEDLLNDPSQLARATERLSAWQEFQARYYDGVQGVSAVGGLARVHVRNLSEGAAGIAVLNSAWRASSDADHGRLLVGETQVTNALDAIASYPFRIVAVHHPFGWLMPFDEDQFRGQCEAKAQIVLSGHEHDASPMVSATARGGFVHDRAGCLYQHHSYPNSYSVIDTADRDPRISISVRSWYPEAGGTGKFDKAIAVAPEGVVSLTLHQRADSSHPPFSIVRSALVQRALSSLYM